MLFYVQLAIARAVYKRNCAEADRLERLLCQLLREGQIDRPTFDQLFEAVQPLRRRPLILTQAGRAA